MGLYKYDYKTFIDDVRDAVNLPEGVTDVNKILRETDTVSVILNPKHRLVRPVQKRLLALGYTEIVKITGVAKGDFTAAVEHFQRDNACEVTGELTARFDTWRALLTRR